LHDEKAKSATAKNKMMLFILISFAQVISACFQAFVTNLDMLLFFKPAFGKRFAAIVIWFFQFSSIICKHLLAHFF
jgi:hypothetical protein